MSNKGLFNNGITTSECDYYYTKGYQQGRADSLNDFIAWLKTQIVGIDKKTEDILIAKNGVWEVAIDEYKKESKL